MTRLEDTDLVAEWDRAQRALCLKKEGEVKYLFRNRKYFVGENENSQDNGDGNGENDADSDGEWEVIDVPGVVITEEFNGGRTWALKRLFDVDGAVGIEMLQMENLRLERLVR